MAWHQFTFLNFYITRIVHDYFVPRSRLKMYGDRAFSVVAPKLWNQLPPELRSVTSVNHLRTHLKTYLFKLAYDV